MQGTTSFDMLLFPQTTEKGGRDPYMTAPPPARAGAAGIPSGARAPSRRTNLQSTPFQTCATRGSVKRTRTSPWVVSDNTTKRRSPSVRKASDQLESHETVDESAEQATFVSESANQVGSGYGGPFA